MGKFLTDSWHFYQTPPPHPDPLQVLNTFMIVKNSQLESAISAVVSSFPFFFSNFWLHKKVIYPPPPPKQNENENLLCMLFAKSLERKRTQET